MSGIDAQTFLAGLADVIEVYARELAKLDPCERTDALGIVLGGVIRQAAGETADADALQVLYDAAAARIFARVMDIDGIAGREIAGHA